MRLVVGLFLLVAACTEHGQGGAVVCLFMGDTHFPGDFFPAGDGCNFCQCEVDGNVGRVTCSEDTCSDGGVVDGSGGACAPQGGCAGPLCGGSCCGQGEQCLDGAVCSCNGSQSCSNGDFCAQGGPIGGTDVCGVTCCGSPNSPCPL